jgi:hypothetical protein
MQWKLDALAFRRNIGQLFNVEKSRLHPQKSPFNVFRFDLLDACEILPSGKSTPMQRFNQSDRLAVLPPIEKRGNRAAWSLHPR